MLQTNGTALFLIIKCYRLHHCKVIQVLKRKIKVLQEHIISHFLITEFFCSLVFIESIVGLSLHITGTANKCGYFYCKQVPK